MDPYRGDEGGTALRLEQLDREIERKKELFTDEFWKRVAPVWDVPTTSPASDDPRADREARLEMLEQAVARARSGPWAEAGLPASALERVDHLEVLQEKLPLRLRISPPTETAGALAVARFHSSGSELVYRGFRQWAVRFEADGAPIEIRVRPNPNDRAATEEAVLTTTVCPAARLSLKQEGIFQDILEFVGFVDAEIEIGAPDFDGIYLIEGCPATAEAWLTPAVRKSLLAHDLEGTPSLLVKDGIAVFHASSLKKPALMRLTSLLSTWHACPPTVPLLREP